MQKNISKYLSYKTAWERIEDANANGYYFESITICESIISDRLLSYLASMKDSKLAKHKKPPPFAQLIEGLRVIKKDLPRINGVELGLALDAWRMKRNKAIHGLAKSFPGQPTEDVNSFLKDAEITAIEGEKLTKAVCVWHKKELTKFKSMNK